MNNNDSLEVGTQVHRLDQDGNRLPGGVHEIVSVVTIGDDTAYRVRQVNSRRRTGQQTLWSRNALEVFS